MTRSTFRRAEALALALLVMAGTAAATAMFRENLDQLTRASDMVVRGTVKRVQSRWTSDNRRIVTDIDIEVAESLKGKPGATVRVTQPGGEVGEIGQKVSGLASFSTGEEVVVFLQRSPGDVYRVEGMAQGKFRVQRSSDGTGAFAVPEPLGDAMLIDPHTRERVAPAVKVMELEELRREVKAAIKRDAEGKKDAP